MTATWYAMNVWLPLSIAGTTTAGVLVFAVLTGRFRRRPAGARTAHDGQHNTDPPAAVPHPARERS